MSTIELTAPPVEGAAPVLTGEALEFVADHQRRFGPRRNELLAVWQARAAEISRTCSLDFLPETASIREAELDLQRDDVTVTAKDLLAFSVPDARTTEAGLRSNVEVSLLYLANWINGTGVVGIHNLMEDAATAEISRSQIWQWICNGAKLDSGETVTADLVTRVLDEEMPAITQSLAAEPWAPARSKRLGSCSPRSCWRLTSSSSSPSERTPRSTDGC